MRMLILFQKGERLRHMGHLDLQRTMQRALRRSGLPIRYSQGFHPHVLVSFASALSMGVPSVAEVMDVPMAEAISSADCLERLNAALPEALQAHRAAMVKDEYPKLMGILKQAAYAVELSGENAADWQRAIDVFLAREETMAMRKSKRAEKLVNIRPMVHELDCEEAKDGVSLQMRLSLEETATLKPEVLLQALADLLEKPLPAYVLLRTGLYQVLDGQPASLLPGDAP